MSKIEPLVIQLKFKDAGSQAVIDKVKNSLQQLQLAAKGARPNVEGLRKVILAQGQASTKSVSNINAQRTALQALRDEARIGGKAFNQLTTDIKKLDAQMAKGKGRRSGGQRGGRALAATQAAGAVISGGIFGGPEGAAGGLIGAAFGGVGGAFLGAGIGASIGNIRKQFGGIGETVAEINSMKIALAGVSTSAEDYQQSINSVMSISKEFLFPVDKAIGEFTRLKAAVVGAGFGTKETTDVFRGFAAAILATGGNSEKLSGALLAASQVFSKGKVQAEELRGQIGERLPGAFTTFAQSIGVGSKELDEMLRKGEVSTENFVEFTRTLFARYSETAKTLGSSPEKAGQRLQLALSLATIEYGGFFQKVGAGFQDYITKLVNFAVDNKETFKSVAANVVVFAQDVARVVKNLVLLIKEAFGGMFVFIGKSLKVFVEQIVAPFFNAILAGINLLASRVKLGQAERKIGIGRAGEIRVEETEALKKEKGITSFGKLGTSIAQNDEIERRAQARILEEAGMAPKKREDRLAAALKGLDKAFEVFDPTSGFATSLGTKPPGGDGSTVDGGGSTTKDNAQRLLQSATALVTKQRETLSILRAQNEVEKLLNKQANDRAALELRFANLKKQAKNEEAVAAIQEQQNEATRLQQQTQRLQLENQSKDAIEKAFAGVRNLVDKNKEKIETDKEYKRLIDEGLLPAQAKQIIALNRQFQEGDKILKQRLLDLRALIAKGGLEDETIANLEREIELIKQKRRELGQETEDGVKGVKDDPGGKAKTNFETFQDSFKAGIKDMGDLYKNLGEIGAKAFQGMGDILHEFVTTGKADFKGFAASILSDLSKMFIKFALFQALKGIFPGLGLANGGVINQGKVVPYAKGGVVNQPTIFPMTNGTGVMGEAGPEAVMPLKRGPSGRLGVEVNQSDLARNAMNRYSRRGSPSGGDAEAQTQENASELASTPSAIDVRYTVERINSVDYVTADQFQNGMQQAAQQGAKQGEQQTLKRLQMSGSARKRIGI